MSNSWIANTTKKKTDWKTRMCVAGAMVLASVAGYSFNQVKNYYN